MIRTKKSFPRFLISVALLLGFIVGLANSNSAQRQSSRARSTPDHPKLVLLLVVDQFRYDYLERFSDLFGNNGLNRLMRDGASWVDANYDHVPTYTAPGHATLMTGAYPAETGIVANDWPDRESGKRVSSITDETVKSLGGGQGDIPASPRRLMASTVGDELRLATNDRAKVIGISVKDRSAILPAGRHANAAYWFSPTTGNMTSSTFYFNELPAWVTAFNQSRPADKYFGQKWERLLPEAEYVKRVGEDAPPWENIGQQPGDTNRFPHVITGGASSPSRQFYNALDYSPFSNDLLVAFTEQAIINEQLGQDDITDVLSISFSADDYVGHRYGPYSQEMMDITLRVDRQIGTLLDFLDSRVGLKNMVVIFSADHGMAPIPEHAAALGLTGGRVKSADILTAVRGAISARFNPQHKQPDPTSDYIYTYDDFGARKDGFINNNLYFNTAALRRDGIDLDELERVAGEAALTVPGIARYFTRSQFERGEVSLTDPIERRAIHGFYPRRSGDVILIQDAYKYVGDTVTATHGSPYSYDTHVPVVIMSSALEAGRYYQSATPADIAPTIAAILRIQPPSSNTGRILIEALIKPSDANQRK